MKNIFAILISLFLCNSFYGQEKNDFSNHELMADFGSLRNRYIYPINNLRYSSPLLKNINLRFSARLRSYGTLYFFSQSAYDITPLAEYYFIKTDRALWFSTGIGADTRIRLSKDSRSKAITSIEPLISITAGGKHKNILFKVPLWTKFYSNGISYSILPEVSVILRENISIFARYELSYLNVYNITHEWQQDNFIGMYWHIR